METEMSSHQKPFWTLVNLSQQYQTQVIKGTIYSFLNKFFDIAPEILIGIAIDLVVQKEDSFLARIGIRDTHDQLFLLAFLTFMIWAFESLFEYLYKMTWRGLSQNVQHDLRLQAYDRVNYLSVGEGVFKSTGQIVSIVNDDINQLERFLDQGAPGMIQVVTSTVLISIVFFYLSPVVAILALLPIPVIIAGAFWFQKKLEPLYRDVRAKASLMGARLTQNILGLETIKAQTAEAFEAQRIRELSERYRQANAQAIAVSSLFTPLIRMAILTGFMGTLLYGGLKTLNGELTAGSFGILVFLTQRLLWPLTGIADISDLYQRARASTERVLELIGASATGDSSIQKNSKITFAATPSPALGSSFGGDIEFDRVVYRYPGRKGPLFHELSFKIPHQNRIGLVGATGSGKSTIARLLLKFLEPQGGKITIGGVDLHSLDPQVIRQKIGYVSQDVFLVEGTIADNICYGSFQAARDSVIAAAMIAHAHEFISKLPDGYDTVIGERGYSLSGGQKQRLAIARAIIKDPPVLILDEATSAVDHESEFLIQEALESVCQKRTVLMIAHRLSSLKKADTIFVLNEGAIVEQGSHQELLELRGFYARQWFLFHETPGQ
jgi:ATP-binding cassette subfamily B protein